MFVTLQCLWSETSFYISKQINSKVLKYRKFQRSWIKWRFCVDDWLAHYAFKVSGFLFLWRSFVCKLQKQYERKQKVLLISRHWFTARNSNSSCYKKMILSLFRNHFIRIKLFLTWVSLRFLLNLSHILCTEANKMTRDIC